MLGKISIIIGIIVGIFTIIAGLYAFFTKTSIGIRCWTWLTTAFWRLVSFVRRHRKKILVLLLVLLFILAVGFAAYRYCWLPQTKTVEGRIYYKPSEERPGLDPVPDVIVSVSQEPQLQSEPTDLEGRFVIQGVPANLQVTQLRARFAGQDYLAAYNPDDNYAIIPRPPNGQPYYREITDTWIEVSLDECPTEDIQQFANRKRFVLTTYLPIVPEKQQAFVTVELRNPANVVILNAFVLSPSQNSGLRRNAMEGLDKNTMHRWRFDLPNEGLHIQLEVCLGSNDNSVALSQPQLHTYEIR